MQNPLVSIICLCHNQERYVAEALLSALNQTYEPVELVVVDDASEDQSVDIIEKLISDLPEVRLIRLKENVGNCRAFNIGLHESSGKYIIDLAADDVLNKTRVEKGIEEFRNHSRDFGVHFTDAVYIDEYSNILKYHYERDQYGSLINSVPEGDIYVHLVEKYFICTPTMMIKREVFDRLKGYDESLAYEDFDFWIRSSRYFKYMYSDEVLVKKRALAHSMSKSHFSDPYFMQSTLRVCEKIYSMNEKPEENRALVERVKYEMRQAILYRHYDIAEQFFELFKKSGAGILIRIFYRLIISLRLDLKWLIRFQQKPV